MKVALYSYQIKESDIETVTNLVEAFEKFEVELLFEASFYQVLKEFGFQYSAKTFCAETQLDGSFDLFVSFGGDGSMLRSVTLVKDFGIPIIGINTGRLGYLSTVNIDEVTSVVAEFIAGNFEIEERTLIVLENANTVLGVSALDFALNEITVIRKDTASMITIETFLNGEYLTTYWADGLIVSTPTGSTGYSLSCGGPVIAPMTRSLLLTPIAPHNLNARPLVVSEDTEIRIKVYGREPQHMLSLDSRLQNIPVETELSIKKAPFKVKMVKFNSESFIKTLRQKLLWGEDKRN